MTYSISQNKHLLEYIPGTYGDIVSNLIACTVDGFFNPNIDNDEYWNHNNSLISRNKYILSLRGNGYEHIEHYTDLVMDHFIDCLGEKYQQPLESDKFTDVLFNTHPKLLMARHHKIKSITRTLSSTANLISNRYLTLETNFDTILMSAANVYLTTYDTHPTTVKDNQKFYMYFYNTLKYNTWAKKSLPADNLLNIDCISKITPEHISVYGNVNENKFEEMLDSYKKEKLTALQKNTYILSKKLNSEVMEYIKDIYEGIDSLDLNIDSIDR